MTGGPSSLFRCFHVSFRVFSERKVWAQGDIWSSGIYLPDGFGFPYIGLVAFGFGLCFPIRFWPRGIPSQIKFKASDQRSRLGAEHC